ncbi:MAG TPA: PP2C family protein-serine/threonine phosphatase [Thermoanaerobaculia bacterium]|nr:PP2C family protein-serine/threonine phosphatase [Thermoanaerobaculia bacterium]
MDPTYTLDDVARTTDESAVRRRFDRRNLAWSFGLLIFFAMIFLILTASSAHRGAPWNPVFGALGFALAATTFLLMRDAWRIERGTTRGSWRAGTWVSKHVTATTITFIVASYALILTITSNTDDWIPWVMIVPYLVIGVRMAVAEHVLLHAMFGTGALLLTIFASTGKDSPPEILLGSSINNVIALAIVLIASHRLRRKITREWSERRASAREQIRMRDELRYARELQLSMLPECAPSTDWADLCAISLPATEVGGDYYDYFVDRDRIALVCGDVAGHGMASGIMLSALRSGFTLLRDSLGDPAAVLKRLHDLVALTSRRRMLVTVTVVLLDRVAKRATIASAGHPPVVLRHADGRVESIELFAPPLGVRLPVDIPQRQLDIESGDVFVLHSDGIYETRNAEDEVYGLDRLFDVVRLRGNDGAESLRDAIIADVERFRGSALQADDVTVVVAKIA